MRRVQKGKRGRKPRKKTEPLAEGIMRTARGRDWASMSDDELVEYARRIIEENGLERRNELSKSDRGLYHVLLKRKLLGRVIPESAHSDRRDWASMSDDELVRYAKSVIGKMGIQTKAELVNKNRRLHGALQRRGLSDAVGLEIKRHWAPMSDEELIRYAKELIDDKKIRTKQALAKVDSGLYDVLLRRKLTDSLGLKNQRRKWASKNDAQVIAIAKRYMKERGIQLRSELAAADPGLYSVVWQRGLLDAVGFTDNARNWRSMDDDEIVRQAKMTMEQQGLKSRTSLARADQGLYQTLVNRRLLDRVFQRSTRRPKHFFSKMGDDELVEYALGIIKQKGSKNRRQLENADKGLYQTLRKRKLLDRVFARIESQKKREAVQQVVDAMGEFDSS